MLPSFNPLLPTGFVFFPAGQVSSSSTTSKSITNRSAAFGCLLAVGMQLLANAIPSAKLSLSSVTAVNLYICSTVYQISSTIAGGTLAEPTYSLLIPMCQNDKNTIYTRSDKNQLPK
ncbi:hypothetical protein HPP92_003316 [Vanilla planifolia]|uniref:HD-Zip IV C-terminal domain-containing protein n=1 Tax=Vanilla planifolia TaxID=51239 RepID=A0A835VIU4_VANPL|nr:hypothetical protein HPP92_003316 [Vanilla planifolia]